MSKPEPKLGAVPFTEAIDFLQSKVRLPTATWTDIWKGEHANAFVVAGAMKDDLLLDFHTAIQKAIKDGTTLAEFRKDFDSIVAKHGWSYNGSPGWRSRVIYHTNMRQASMAGHWQQIQRTKKQRPYLRYVARKGGNRRPEHQALHGTVLPVDHPFWRTHYPMNGWGCKCTVQSLSEADLKRYGYKVSEEAPAIEYEERTINTINGKKTIEVPKGIDPGFDYNPGEAAWGNTLSDKAVSEYRASGEWKQWKKLSPGDHRSENRSPLVPAEKISFKLGPKAEGREKMAKMLRKELGGEEKVFTLADGSPLLANAETLARHIPIDRSQFIPMLTDLINDPYEIWISFEEHVITGRVALRKRLIKVVELDKNKVLLLVAQASNGIFETWTYIPIRRMAEANKHRVGKLVWGKD
ncbi:phage minor head protein [Maridesulfovibrio sp.]|uniref:phage minor head protein n=1 Tax=Maridesulfovibrio sp. TaxID=2795000 RepID=UPI0029CA0CB6|nr:phage minor head protein [Maridesulfovibrio sp.]